MRVTVSRFGTGIVQRLRLVSLTIVVLLLVATFVGGMSLVQLKSLQEDVTDRHVPMLAMSSKLQTEFAGVYLLAESVARAGAYQDAAELERRAGEAFRRIEPVIARMRELDVAGPSLQMLSETIVGAEEELGAALNIARRVVADRQTLEMDRRAIRAVDQRFRTLVEPAYTNTIYALRQALDRVLDEGRFDESGRNTFDSLMIEQDSLTSLIRGSDGVVDLSTALSDQVRSAGDIAEKSKQIRFELGTLPMILLRIGDVELRETLAGPLGELRALVLRKNGLLGHVDRLRIDSEAMTESRTQLIEAFGDMSTLVNRSVAEVESAAAAMEDELARATELTLTVLTVTAALVLAILLLSGYVVLERQINRRIGVLADEVLRIASGDDAEPVDVSGDDEIGEIGRSLKVFRENARELRRSNEELEKFAYAAAHDMRSPLRAIESLATWTLEDAGDSLPEDCRDNLETLLKRAQRLSTLQNDLLDYAQVGEVDSSIADTDIAVLVGEIHALIDPDRRFEITVTGDTGPLRTHLTPLRQILLNLFTNAIKHHDRGGGIIAVTAHEAGSRLHMTVRDDGPGIEPQFHEKIYGLFTTLQSKDVVEGSGLGLSMVRKLVERYDGRMRVESDPEQARGTTFAFDLPTQAYDTPCRQAA